MKSLTRHIPNFFTCISLLFGFYAAILGISGRYWEAMVCIFCAAVFDFADGLAARSLKAYSDLGKELDSLSDVVSFGVAPGMMVFSFIDKLLLDMPSDDFFNCKILLLSAFVVPVFSALRLAKFNIDKRQKTSFIGLPVPAHAMLWSSFITVLATDGLWDYGVFPQFAELLATVPSKFILTSLSGLVVVTSVLMVSEIPMFSLKISSLSWKANKLPYILIASAVLFIILFGVLGITLTILFYILLSVFSISHRKAEHHANVMSIMK